MQPNNNDPLSQGGQAPGMGQPGMPQQAPSVPDWQQGLGAAAAAQVVNPATVPTPGTPVNGAAPGNPTVPDWQQGLGNPVVPAPMQPPTGMPGVPVVSQPAYGPTPGMGMGTPMPPAKQGLPKPLIAVIAVVIVVVLGAAGYFIFAKAGKPQSADNAARTSAHNAKKSATAISTLTSVTLAVPADMGGFLSDAGTATAHDFLTTGSDATNGGCELAFGTGTATELPGATIDDMVAPGIKSLKDNGVTVDGPKAEAALILKDAAGKEYSLPTISYSFTQGTKNAKVVYSIAVTTNGARAFVRRDCAVIGQIDTAKMTQLEQKAAQITVTAQSQ